jgi:hypothetical protein
MGWWADLRREEAEQWYAGPITTGDIVSPGTRYLSVYLRSLYLGSVRKGLTKYYGAVTGSCSVPSKAGGRAEAVTVTTPDQLKNADAAHLDRVVVDNHRLLGPTPYVGGDLDVEVGLFSIAAADLLGPYLGVLEDLAKVAGGAFVQAAQPFVAPVTRGLRLLLGDGDAKALEIGLSKTWQQPVTGLFAVARIPAGGQALSYDPQLRMLTLAGQPVREPHMVLSVEATDKRPDWQQIPELLAAYGDIKREALRQDMVRTEEALAAFRVRARFSPDLIGGDADSIVAAVQKEIDAAFGAVQTSGASIREMRIREFDELVLAP